MADEKPKHKPQQKRTLEEVLKSLQDLIRNDLVSTQPLRQSWRESGRDDFDPDAFAAEPDTFHKALFKLDQIINEKIIEPVERALQTPPEPLFPDEEMEIEWEVDQPESKRRTDRDRSDIEAADLAALDSASASLDEIELLPLEAEPSPPNEPDASAAIEPSPETLSIEAAPEQIEPEPIVQVAEVLEAAPVLSVEEPATESIEIELAAPPELSTEETIDLSPAPEPSEPADPQQRFDFAAARAARPPLSPPEMAPPADAQSTLIGEASEIPATIEFVEPLDTGSTDDVMTVDLSADTDVPADKSNAPPEQPDVLTVEPSSVGYSDAYAIEFTVEPKTPAPAKPPKPDAKREPATTEIAKPLTVVANQPPEGSAVKEQAPPPNSTDAPETPPEPKQVAADAAGTPEEIPVLSEVADLATPASPPLPKASQARDIAIRVIAKLNIERRKTGEKPLDIKTIERLQQYLAEALSKRALSKPK